MNFLPGRVEGGRFVSPTGITAAMPAEVGAASGAGVVGGVRPDQIALGETGARAEVAVVEPTGAETLVLLRAGDRQIHALIRDRMPLRPGDIVGVSVRPGGLHLFDAATEARL